MSTSNTLLFEERGWTVLCVEPNPSCEEFLRNHRRIVEMVACDTVVGEADLHVYEDAEPSYTSLRPAAPGTGWGGGPLAGAPWHTVRVPVITLDLLLERHDFPKLDLLSIDTEGTELEVLRGFTISRWKPLVIICESWIDQSAVVPYLADRGYGRIERRGVNDLFVRRDS